MGSRRAECLKATGLLHPMKGTTLYAQASSDDKLVAKLIKNIVIDPPRVEVDVKTSGLPELDNAPGGTLRSFGIACDAMKSRGAVDCAHEWVDFVPTVSAVAIRDLDSPDLYANIGNGRRPDSGLDDFDCASRKDKSEGYEHSRVTAELADWLVAQLPK